MSSDTKSVLAFAILVTAIMGIVIVFPNYVAEKQCRNYTEITGIQTRWKFFDSCYVKTPSGWQRWDEYKARAITHEDRKQ